MPVKRIDPEGWYEYVGEGAVLCGKCVQEDLRKTATGEYTGDETVELADIEELLDPVESGEKYQCDNCLKQSENYDDDDD